MKKTFSIVLLALVLLVLAVPAVFALSEYDIEKIIGANLSPGTYKVNVTRESQDLYKITNRDIYIKTRYCYEYCYYKDVIIEITGYGGYSIGKIYF